MANADTPFGFVPVGNLDGSPYNGGTFRCALLAADATATFIGDAVKLSGTASADGTAPSVAQVAATEDLVFGVITSFEADPATSLDDQYRKASTLRYCQVAPALDNLFKVQYAGTFAITEVGEGNDITVGSGSTVTGVSAMELDVTGQDQFRVLGLYPAPDNEIGANSIVVGRFAGSALHRHTMA